MPKRRTRTVGNKKRQAAEMGTRCDACGEELPEEPSLGAGEACWKCSKCGAEFDYYYRMDGEWFSVPEAWGRCVAVMFGPEMIRACLPEELAEPGRESYDLDGEIHYIFQSDDGTIRRAQMRWGHFGPDCPRPDNVPERIEWFHFWNVDLWPVDRRACDE